MIINGTKVDLKAYIDKIMLLGRNEADFGECKVFEYNNIMNIVNLTHSKNGSSVLFNDVGYENVAIQSFEYIALACSCNSVVISDFNVLGLKTSYQKKINLYVNKLMKKDKRSDNNVYIINEEGFGHYAISIQNLVSHKTTVYFNIECRGKYNSHRTYKVNIGNNGILLEIVIINGEAYIAEYENGEFTNVDWLDDIDIYSSRVAKFSVHDNINEEMKKKYNKVVVIDLNKYYNKYSTSARYILMGLNNL